MSKHIPIPYGRHQQWADEQRASGVEPRKAEHVEHTDERCCPIWEHEHHVDPHRGCILR